MATTHWGKRTEEALQQFGVVFVFRVSRTESNELLWGAICYDSIFTVCFTNFFHRFLILKKNDKLTNYVNKYRTIDMNLKCRYL